MALSHSPSIVTDGLVLCLDAANPKSYPGSGVTWGDLSQLNFGGNLINGPSFNIDGGGSIACDGVNDFIDVPSWNIVIGTSGFSAEMWFKTNGTGAINQQALAIRKNTPSYQQFCLSIGSNINVGGGSTKKIAVWNFDSGGAGSSGNILSATDVVTNQWVHVVATRTNLSTKLYINGVLDAQTTPTTSISIGEVLPLTIGSLNPTGSLYFGARIANVKIYRKELSAQEVLQNFNALRGRFGI